MRETLGSTVMYSVRCASFVSIMSQFWWFLLSIYCLLVPLLSWLPAWIWQPPAWSLSSRSAWWSHRTVLSGRHRASRQGRYAPCLLREGCGQHQRRRNTQKDKKKHWTQLMGLMCLIHQGVKGPFFLLNHHVLSSSSCFLYKDDIELLSIRETSFGWMWRFPYLSAAGNHLLKVDTAS